MRFGDLGRCGHSRRIGDGLTWRRAWLLGATARNPADANRTNASLQLAGRKNSHRTGRYAQLSTHASKPSGSTKLALGLVAEPTARAAGFDCASETGAKLAQAWPQTGLSCANTSRGSAGSKLGMRFLHTSDWHLGHKLFGIDRVAEHRRFLQWLRTQVREHNIDVVLIAGDIFDSANPPAAAQEMWYDFLAGLTHDEVGCQIVAIGGNHDSAARVDAPAPLVRALDIAVVGGRARADRLLRPAEMVVPVFDRSRQEKGWVAAVPFLRPSDVPLLQEIESESEQEWPLALGMKQLYHQIWQEIAAQAQPEQPVIAMGHCFLAGGAVSELSERRIFGGNQHAISAELFADDWSYVALGHLHRAQKVSRESLRYCGSPIALALDERDYVHQVVIVETKGREVVTLDVLPVPRAVALPRVPARGALSVDDALAAVSQLPAVESKGDLPAPFLEVVVQLTQPEPQLRAKLEAVLADKGYFLARVAISREAAQAGDTNELSVDLDALAPHQVFAQLWQSQHDGEVPADIALAFDELVLSVTSEETV